MKLLAVALCAAAAGCAVDASTSSGGPGDPGNPGSPAAPRLNVLLTDAPGDFEAVWVNIARVEIEAASGWQPLTDAAQRFDLLTLRNDVTAALGGATLAPGTYGQLRLLVDEASVVVDGVESPLAIASGAQTGIKIPLGQTLEADMEYTLTLDYDAAKSVKTTGQGYLMTPVITVKDVVATPITPEPTDPSDPTDPTDPTTPVE